MTTNTSGGVRETLRRAVLIALAVLLSTTMAPVRAGASPPTTAQRQFTVMTYNLYLGADLTPLFGKSGIELVQAAATAFAHVAQTDFPARAEAIASLIAEESPDVIGLQEVALWQTAPLDHPDQLQPVYDFLEILLGELAEIGHPYRAVAVNANFTGALPISATTLASFTDRDAIIARADLPPSRLRISNPTSQNFQASLPVPLGGTVIQVPRGWSTVDVRFAGKSFRLANTHLEAYSEQVRNLQAQELAASLTASPLPIVLTGDINSLPTDLAGAYGILTSAGFVDGWVEAMDGTPGYTAGQTDDLTNVPSTIDHTVDYILHNQDGRIDALTGSGDIVGEELDDRTPSGLWPSDHAGVVLGTRTTRP